MPCRVEGALVSRSRDAHRRYTVLARGNPRLRGVVVRAAYTMLSAAALLVVVDVVPGVWRAVCCWVAALVIDHGG
jgi:hypothetical protein